MLPHPEEAEVPRIASAQSIAYLYAGILVVMAVAQLFTLDSFIGLLFDIHLGVGWQITALLAPLIITLEVFALPFLLRMTVSRAFRWVSMYCGWAVALVWMYVTVTIAASGVAVQTVGFLGTIGDLVPGWWAVSIGSLFGIMATWASVGLWPGQRTHKKRKR